MWLHHHHSNCRKSQVFNLHLLYRCRTYIFICFRNLLLKGHLWDFFVHSQKITLVQPNEQQTQQIQFFLFGHSFGINIINLVYKCAGRTIQVVLKLCLWDKIFTFQFIMNTSTIRPPFSSACLCAVLWPKDLGSDPTLYMMHLKGMEHFE